MKKNSRVVFSNEGLQIAYDELPENDFLKKAIKKTIEQLRLNAFFGTQIKKEQIPLEYRHWTNLWKVNLPRGWRLIYSISHNNTIELLATVHEWSNHKNYERKFKY